MIVRARMRGAAKELVVAQEFGERASARSLVRSAVRDAGCDYSLRLGRSDRRAGEVALPGGGPRLTWRALGSGGMPPLSNWLVSMGDIELF